MTTSLMSEQARAWSRSAQRYEQLFIDPYRADAHNPILAVLARIQQPESKVAADLGCGTGPLLPLLSHLFQRVVAIDFAEGMLARARERCQQCVNVEFREHILTELSPFVGQFDVAIAVNSLVMADVRDIDQALRQIHLALKPGGWFLGIVPAMDAVHYLTMLLLDRALASGKPMPAARKNVAHLADHTDYDFAFSQCAFEGLEQHYWQPSEVRYRLRRAGFTGIRLAKVHLAWEQFSRSKELQKYSPPWDWCFRARRPIDRQET